MNSVVINTYDRPETLSRCLGALARQKGIDAVEIVVVDDGSPADFKAVERLWKTRLNLRYLKPPHSGRAGARNRGAKAATGERLLFLGDDVMVRPGWLEAHAAGEGRPDLAILGPYPLDARPPYPPAFARWADSTDMSGIADPENAGFEHFVTGNVSMDREKFLELGGFDERFVEYGWEDIDLGYRFVQEGGRIRYDERAKAVHEHPRMTRADLWRREYESGITAWTLWEKWRRPDFDYMKFWGEAPTPGPEWRRRAADRLIGAIERARPDASILPRLYERTVFAWRHAGAAEGMRRSREGGGKRSE